MNFEIRFSTEMSLVRRRLTNLGDDLKKELDQKNKEIAESAAAYLRVHTPGAHGSGEWKSTGELAASWKVVQLEGSHHAGARWAVVNTDPRAHRNVPRGTRTLLHILEYGTRDDGYPITAPYKKKLRFWWTKENREVVVSKVKHPGIRPYGFIRGATAEAKRQQALASAALQQRVRRSKL